MAGVARVFSGVQPTGALHLGNYFGAVRKLVESQARGDDVTVAVVDLHSITTPQPPETLRRNSLECAATLVACGVDPRRSTLFLQSSVGRHAELCWVLGTVSTIARLSRLPQYREKARAFKDAPLGLLAYPVLQAADVLLHRATRVPVGADQAQHLQIAHQLARAFNHRFGDTFAYPLGVVGDDARCKIRSLRDPSKKMSKSDPDVKSRVLLSDDRATILHKFKKAVTDFTPEVTYDPETRPGVSNLVDIHSLVTGDTPEEICELVRGTNTGTYKFVVAEAVNQHLEPIREKIEELSLHPNTLIDILLEGKMKAGKVAELTMQEVYHKVGIGIPDIKQSNFFEKTEISH